MRVELDSFSGRPNPQWELEAQTVRHLRAIHAQLVVEGGPAREPPALGYRGFRYTLDDVAWRAWAGTLSSSREVLGDPERLVEHLLLATLPAELGALRPRLVDAIETAI